MKNHSAYWVISIGVVLFIASILRFIGYEVSSLVVTLISVIAILITLSDVLENTKYRKFGTKLQFSAIALFVITFVLWIFPRDVKFPYIQNIGDGSTIMGLSFVIGLYGLKEILEHKSMRSQKIANEINFEYTFKVTKNEYEEVQRINDITERLKKLDGETFPINRLHDGWAQFSDILHEYMQLGIVEQIFYDGKNREKFKQFIIQLDKAAEIISNQANTDPQTLRTKNIDIGLYIDEVSIQPLMNNMHIKSIEETYKELYAALSIWEEFKGSVNKRYEIERAELRNKVDNI